MHYFNTKVRVIEGFYTGSVGYIMRDRVWMSGDSQSGYYYGIAVNGKEELVWLKEEAIEVE